MFKHRITFVGYDVLSYETSYFLSQQKISHRSHNCKVSLQYGVCNVPPWQISTCTICHTDGSFEGPVCHLNLDLKTNLSKYFRRLQNNMGHDAKKKSSSGVLTMSDTNQPVQVQKMARRLKFSNFSDLVKREIVLSL